MILISLYISKPETMNYREFGVDYKGFVHNVHGCERLNQFDLLAGDLFCELDGTRNFHFGKIETNLPDLIDRYIDESWSPNLQAAISSFSEKLNDINNLLDSFTFSPTEEFTFGKEYLDWKTFMMSKSQQQQSDLIHTIAQGLLQEAAKFQSLCNGIGYELSREMLSRKRDILQSEHISFLQQIRRRMVNSVNIDQEALTKDINEHTASMLEICTSLMEARREYSQMRQNLISFLTNGFVLSRKMLPRIPKIVTTFPLGEQHLATPASEKSPARTSVTRLSFPEQPDETFPMTPASETSVKTPISVTPISFARSAPASPVSIKSAPVKPVGEDHRPTLFRTNSAPEARTGLITGFTQCVKDIPACMKDIFQQETVQAVTSMLRKKLSLTSSKG